MFKSIINKNLPLIAALLFLAALIHRNSTLFLSPQFWAEDFTVYFVGDMLLKGQALLAPHNGYIQLGSRLIAYISGMAPLSLVPWLYSYLYILCILMAGILCYSSSAFNGYSRLAATLVLILIPVSSESFLSMTYFHFTLGCTMAFALYEIRAKSYAHLTGLLGSYFLVSFSSPFGIIAIPFAAWKLFKERTRYAMGLLLISLGSALLMAPAVASRAANVPSGSYWDRAQVFMSLFFGWLLGPNFHSFYLNALVATVTILVIGYYMYRNKAILGRPLFYFIGFGAAILFVGLNNSSTDGANTISQYGQASRYFLIASQMFFLTLISIASFSKKPWIIVTVVIVSFGSYFLYVTPGSHYFEKKMDWSSFTDCLANDDRYCSLYINPTTIGVGFFPSIQRLNSIDDTNIFQKKNILETFPHGPFDLPLPLLPGTKISQKIKNANPIIGRVAFTVVTSGTTPSDYLIKWTVYSIGGKTKKDIANGIIKGSSYTDWATVILPVYSRTEGDIELELYVAQELNVVTPISIPFFHLAAHDGLEATNTNTKLKDRVFDVSFSGFDIK